MEPLLGPGDPPPVTIDNPAGISPFLLVGDHSGRAVPASLDRLGLDEEHFARHIAVDIGVRHTGLAMAALLDCPFIHQRYSRLVIDCNRGADWETAVVATSDGTPVTGNAALSEEDRQARIDAIHRPYHETIATEIRRRRREGKPVVLVSLHSFTPIMNDFRRPWQVGVLHDGGDTRFSHLMLDCLKENETLVVGDNEPYQMAGTDYTVPYHAGNANLPYVEIEVRQDLIGTLTGAAHWADFLSRTVKTAYRRLSS